MIINQLKYFAVGNALAPLMFFRLKQSLQVNFKNIAKYLAFLGVSKQFDTTVLFGTINLLGQVVTPPLDQCFHLHHYSGNLTL